MEDKYQKIFEELKNKIISQLVLTLLKREGKFEVETNISGHAIREVLSQKQKEKWKLIAFLSRTIQAAKKNYKIYNIQQRTPSYSESFNKMKTIYTGCYRKVWSLDRSQIS